MKWMQTAVLLKSITMTTDSGGKLEQKKQETNEIQIKAHENETKIKTAEYLWQYAPSQKVRPRAVVWMRRLRRRTRRWHRDGERGGRREWEQADKPMEE